MKEEKVLFKVKEHQQKVTTHSLINSGGKLKARIRLLPVQGIRG